MEDFLQLQIAVNLFFQHIADLVPLIAQFFSQLGNEFFYFLIMPGLYWCVDSSLGIRIGAMLVISNGFVSSAKLLFHWPRPYWLDSRVIAYAHENSFGFPSGHSSNAAGIWGVLASHIKKKYAWAAVILIIVMIGISRLVLGVHFLVDVIGGWLLGVVLLLLFLRFEKPVARWFTNLRYFHQWLMALGSSLMVIVPGILFAWLFRGFQIPQAWSINAGVALDPFSPATFFTIAGIWGGFLCGYIWFAHRYGRLSMDVKMTTRLVRYLTGIIGAAVLLKGLDLVFPDTGDAVGLVFRYIRYFLTCFWVAGAAPAIFTKMTDTLTEKKNNLQ